MTGRNWKAAHAKELVRQLVRDNLPGLVTTGPPRWTSESISIKPALQQAIPQAVFVPAVRDAADETKPGTKTVFGSLLTRIVMPAIRQSPEYDALQGAIEELRSRLSGEGGAQLDAVQSLAGAITERLRELIEARAIITIQPPDTAKFVSSSATMRLDDGTDLPVGLQGHGVQRALIFALVETLASRRARVEEEGEEATPAESPSRSTVLLFEEPELYIHPHLMRRLRDALVGVSGRQDWQVVCTTHSPFLVDVGADPRSLVIFRRPAPTEPPALTQLQSDPFAGEGPDRDDREALRAVLGFHPTVCEAFFARRAVLVEGPSEVAVLSLCAALLDRLDIHAPNASDVTVVSCGGKWPIVPMARLMREFGIPVRVVHDTDAKDRSDDVLATAPPIDPHRANARIAEVLPEDDIFAVKDTLEDILPGEEAAALSAKPYRAWRRISEFLATETATAPASFEKLIRFVFAEEFDVQVSP